MNHEHESGLTLCLPARRLLPAGRRRLGAVGPDGLQGDRGGQPSSVHGGVRDPGHGRHAVPARLPGLLRSHQGEQMSAALCESVSHRRLRVKNNKWTRQRRRQSRFFAAD